MCGIAGYISSQALNEAEMLGVIKHRGPDDKGSYSTVYSDKKIFLGHTRLSILDLSSNGHQPMLSDDGEVIIIFNGEIYNYEELKNKFLAAEHFHSRTDTEVILKLYLKLGINFINELNGDFAIAIYDKKVSKLFLIKDRIGVKPLYFYSDSSQFVFASEIKSIVASGIKAELAEENVLSYFVFKYVPENKTLHKNILRIDPGTYLEYDLNENRIRTNKYWELKKNDAYKNISYQEAQHILFDLLSDSVKIRLISDVPIGNFLSGGLDSTIMASFFKERKDITHYCARKSESDIKKEGTTSDFYYAEKLAKEWKLNLKSADIGSDEANQELIRKTVYYSDDLIADGSQIPSYLITKNASSSSKVILSGMGADELFLGYAGHLLSMLCTQWLDRFPKFISSPTLNYFSHINQGKGKFLAYRRYIHKIGKYYHYPAYKHGIYSIVGDFENSASVFKGDRDQLIKLFTDQFPPENDVFDSLANFEMKNFLVKNLHYTDRMAMANSVECRVPFLDHRIIEFAHSIPREYKLTNTGTSKRVLKDAFKKQIPDYVLNRRKAGFGMPLRSIFSNEKNINALLDKNFIGSFKNFSLPDIDKVIKAHLSGTEDNSSIIYALISFQEWYKINIH